jgi:hypothetical protein
MLTYSDEEHAKTDENTGIDKNARRLLVAKNIRTCANYDISIHRMDAAREGQGDLLI